MLTLVKNLAYLKYFHIAQKLHMLHLYTYCP
jgi:hypothetical protein